MLPSYRSQPPSSTTAGGRLSALMALLALVFLMTTAPAPVLHAQEVSPGPPDPTGDPAERAQQPPVSADRTDREQEQRLEAVFDQLAELARVDVTVRSGVVRLGGTVVSSEDRELARKLAEQMDGTVVVDDRIEEVRSLRLRLEPMVTKVADRLQDLLAAVPLLGVAILLVLLFAWLSRLLGHLPERLLPESVNPFVRNLTHQVVRIGVVLVGVVLALDLLDATALVGAVLGTAGVVGLALGFAFRDTAENYIASILLSLRQPFAPNDQVVIEGHEGKVVRLTSRATILLTLDGNHVRIPNATVFKSILVNYTFNPERRFDFTVGVGAELALTRVLELGLETLRGTDGVLDDPPPVVLIDSLGDSSVLVHCYGWVDQRQASLVKVKSEAIRQLKEAYDAAAVSMPEPIYQVRQLPSPEPAEPAREERERPADPREVTVTMEGEEPPARATDISPEQHIDRQVDEDRRTGEKDLLDPQAPRE